MSSWFDEPLYLPRAVAAAVRPAFEALAPGSPAVAGHSLGGLAAIALAAEHPSLVPRLVIVDATPGSTPERSQDILDFTADAEFESLDTVIDHALSFRPHGNRRALRRSLLHNTYQRPDGRWTWRHDTRQHPTRDRWEVMFEELPKGWDDAAAVRCPTLLVRGSRSRIVHQSDVDRYRLLVADFRVVEIEDAGHNIHGDQPQALGEAVAAFLDETGASPRGH
jgi:pimeloyl-ACP methyl ester carboxylesterase